MDVILTMEEFYSAAAPLLFQFTDFYPLMLEELVTHISCVRSYFSWNPEIGKFSLFRVSEIRRNDAITNPLIPSSATLGLNVQIFAQNPQGKCGGRR